MHQLQIHDHRDLHLDDRLHLDAVRHLLKDRKNDMDLKHLVHLLHLDVVQNLDVTVRLHLQDVVHLDAQQNLDVVRRDVVHLDVQLPLVAEVDAELRHQLRMDYFLDAEDAELLLQQRMDCYLDEAQVLHPELVVLVLEQQVHLALLCMQQLQLKLPALPHVMPSALRDRHRALLQVQQRVLDLPQTSLEQQPSSLQLS
jgi:hypothetical protein